MPRALDFRPLESDASTALALATAAGAHGAYVRNALAAGEHEGFVAACDGEPFAVAWFGARGNLVLIADDRCQGVAPELAARIHRSRHNWRIVLGPDPLVAALAEGFDRKALAQRRQAYYAADPDDVPGDLVRDDVRAPTVRDRERLARATLALNASDLNIPPNRVDRRWLYDMIDARIADGTTRCIGPAGGLWTKLDFGSTGPGGVVIEGVFTFPDRRGRGLGSQLVATCIATGGQRMSLHVAEHNRAARSAYERAGMRCVGSCSLLLLS
ncbi:MAG TPA: GNAT family N-acetyltransferase [bacterium]|nr:GNAT family N-acetyltransferase [bacterium]